MGIKFNPLLSIGLDFTGSGGGDPTVGGPVVGGTPNSVLVTDPAITLQTVGPLTNGQLIIGSTGNTPVANEIDGTANQVIVTNGAGTITLSLPQDIATTSSPTFDTVIANIDKAGTLDIGTVDSNNINIGSAISDINILNTLDLNTNQIVNVVDPTNPQDAATKAYADTKIPLTQKGANNGVATLDGGGKIPVSQLPSSVMEYKGNWNATTNSPTLADGTGDAGDVYRTNVAGTQDLGSGSQTFAIGDWVVYNGSIWEKSINSNAVVSVNGQSGIVLLDTDDIPEGTNLYFTDVRAQAAITGAASTITTANLTVDRALISNGAGKVAVSTVTTTELQYSSGVTSAIQTQLNNKANTALSNLVAPTAVNVNILPVTDNTIDLGEAGQRYQTLFVRSIHNGNSIVVDLNNTSLTDNSGVNSVKWTTRELIDSSNAISLDYGQRLLTTGATIKLDWSGTNIDINTRKIVNVVDPTSLQDAATKNYVDTEVGVVSGSAITSLTGDVTATGPGAAAATLAAVGTAGTYTIVTTDSKGRVTSGVAPVTGDISLTSFSAADGQAAPANVTGLAFAAGTTRAFDAMVSVSIDATTPLYEHFTLKGIQTAADFSMAVSSVGEDSLVEFSITPAGQIQYTSATYPGFVSATIKFRALTTTI